MSASIRDRLTKLTEDETFHLEEIMESLGWTTDALLEGHKEVSTLELFLSPYSRMLCLSFFPNLTSIHLIGQSISKLEGLQECRKLKSLWVVEAKLTRIEGLDGLHDLSHLFLYSNQISRIENLAHLSGLQVLWLADNRIAALEGLSELPSLSELHMAKNEVSRVHGTLDCNTSLRVLNLAANAVDSFREAQYLAQLPSLREVSFADPHWGASPIAELSNYETYMLCHLPRLTALDSHVLSAESKQLAEATFVKKRMYYNMRVKALQRQVEAAKKDARGGLGAQLTHWHERGAPAKKMRLVLRAAVLNGVFTKADELKDNAGAERMQRKLAALGDALQALDTHAAALDAAFAAACLETHALQQQYARRSVLELETGGNVRLEDGSPTNLWFRSCLDLMASRASPAQLEPFGWAGIRVTKVTHVHNRALRGRFDRAMGRAAEADGARRSVDFLLWGEHPAMRGELEHVLEHGFRDPDEYRGRGLHGAVQLTNSVVYADAARLAEASGAARRRARLLVCKVACSGAALDSSEAVPEARFASAALSTNGRLWDGTLVCRERWPGCSAVQRCCASGGKDRLWFVFEPELAVPEYVVEFEYLTAQEASASGGAAPPAVAADFPGVSGAAQAIVAPLRRFLGARATGAGPALEGGLAGGLEPLPPAIEAMLDDALALAPSMDELSRDADGANTRDAPYGTDRAHPQHLVLCDRGLTRIVDLPSAAALLSLTLAFNQISRLEGLGALTQLRHLDVSHNRLQRIEGLRGLAALTHLDLSHNELSKVEDINLLRKHTSQLLELDLRRNAMTAAKTYFALAVRRLPHLVLLDGAAVSNVQRHEANTTGAAVTLDLLYRSCTFAQHTPTEVRASVGEDGAWWGAVHSIRLEGCHLRRLPVLSKLTSLREASLSDNELTSFDGVSHLTTLESLSYKDNLLQTTEGVQTLTQLKLLDLSRNMLAGFGAVPRLICLTQLSVEDNHLPTLAGLESLTNLMELYAGNNRVSALRDVALLRDLPRLIILDLQGNPVAAHPEYTLYAVYQLRKLKMLDAQGVTAAAQAAAKALYAGRLTLEFLEEKAGPTNWSRVQMLDISNLRIRDVGSVFAGDAFASLRELNLANNVVTGVTGLFGLSSLTVLCLNGNRLGGSAGPAFELPAGDSAADGTVKPLPSLQVLQLGENGIGSIAALRLGALTNLRSLFLHNNNIQRVDGLSALQHLRELVLDRNRIKAFDPDSFAGLTALRELRVEENALRGTAHLGSLVGMQSLHLAFNRINDLFEVERLAALPNLLELTLANNTVARKHGYRLATVAKLPDLQVLDGKLITAEERSNAELMYNVPPPADVAVPYVGKGSPAAGASAAPAAGFTIPAVHLQGHDSRALGLEVVPVAAFSLSKARSLGRTGRP